MSKLKELNFLFSEPQTKKKNLELIQKNTQF